MLTRRDISFSTPSDNILFDQLLLERAESGFSGEVIRFWESPEPFIVLGRVGRPLEELNIEATLKDGISVLRRCSGGGTVVQGPGCMNYAFVLSKSVAEVADLRRSYEYILSKVTDSLKACGIESEFLPISDIALVDGQRKVSGNAQKRGKKFILHHGTLLYGANLSLIDKYLAMPPSMPDYRHQRLHHEFVTNVALDINHFKEELSNRFHTKASEHVVSIEEKSQLHLMRQTVEVGVNLSGLNTTGNN